MNQQDFTKGNKRVTRSCFAVTYFVDDKPMKETVFDRIGKATAEFSRIKRLIKSTE